MKITVTEFKDIVREANKDGFFEEITEDIWSDDSKLDEVLKVFLSELRKKRVVRGKKLYKKVICPKNKKNQNRRKRGGDRGPQKQTQSRRFEYDEDEDDLFDDDDDLFEI